MKKRFFAIILAMAFSLSLTGCGSASSDTKVIEPASDAGTDSTETGSNSAASSAGYVFNYNGMNISVDSDAAPIIEALGEPNTYFESPSCAADGIGKLYTYSDFEIQTYPDGDEDLILYIRLRTDNVKTTEGIDLSNSREDVVAAYGEPTEEVTGSLKYEKDGMSLVFLFDGDSMISIEYDSPLN